MHESEVSQRVRDALAQVEAERNVRVLFACEWATRRRTPTNAERHLHSRPSGKAAAVRGTLPRVTATTTFASSTSTEEAEGNREAGGRASRRDWYLSVEDRRDVIEQPIADDLDVSGWELPQRMKTTGSDLSL